MTESSNNSPVANLWQQCLERLERQIALEELNTWIRPLQLDGNGGNRVRLSAPNDLVRDQVRQHYLEMMREFFAYHGFERNAVTIEVGARSAPRVEQQPERGGGAWGLDDRYRFDNFVLGKSNELAFAAARQVANSPGTVYNPLLLYGSTGLGKTHLLHAAGRFIADTNPMRK